MFKLHGKEQIGWREEYKGEQLLGNEDVVRKK